MGLRLGTMTKCTCFVTGPLSSVTVPLLLAAATQILVGGTNMMREQHVGIIHVNSIFRYTVLPREAILVLIPTVPSLTTLALSQPYVNTHLFS